MQNCNKTRIPCPLANKSTQNNSRFPGVLQQMTKDFLFFHPASLTLLYIFAPGPILQRFMYYLLSFLSILLFSSGFTGAKPFYLEGFAFSSKIIGHFRGEKSDFTCCSSLLSTLGKTVCWVGHRTTA